MKVSLAVISLCFLFGCAAPQYIQCMGRDGNILYLGPYDAEKESEFVVYVNDQTTDYYRKAACRKVQL